MSQNFDHDQNLSQAQASDSEVRNGRRFLRRRNDLTSLFAYVSMVLALYYFVACAPVQFNSVPMPVTPGVVEQCANGSCVSHHTDQISSGAGSADILFVLDNGGSVSDIQKTLASRFARFIQSVSSLDYRIGIATTDVSTLVSDTPLNYPRPVNGNGALQDGKLVQLSDGSFFVTPQTSNAVQVFSQAIQRPETATCEGSGYNASSCPSDDPRGIYAASLQIQRNEQHFFRDGVSMNIVIVSDDDERNTSGFPGRPEASYDQPSSLIAAAAQHFPNNQFRASAIIIKPGDTGCYNQRFGRNGNNQLYGHFGDLYADLVQRTGGYLGSVCDSDYSNVLNSIATTISGQVSEKQIACTPVNKKFVVTFVPQPAQDITVTADWLSNTLHFSQPLPASTTANIEYDCKE
jgi:hypothetical protein